MTTSDDSRLPPSPPEAAEAEVLRLRAEVARLKAEREPMDHTGRTGWWRTAVVALLVLVVALLAPLSVLSTWANGQIEDRDRYLATVVPLADDPDVQAAIAARIEQVVYQYVDLDKVTERLVTAIEGRGLPPRAAATLQAATGPLVSGIRSFVSDRILEFVRSDAFKEAWTVANREAHTRIVGALTGTSDVVAIDNGQITISLGQVIEAVKAQLSASGFGLADRIPAIDQTFTLYESPHLDRVQSAIGWIDGLSTWLAVVALALLALAVFVARDRRRALLAAGIAVAASMLLLGAALNVIRPLYLDALPASSSPEAAGAVYDQVVSFIRFALRGLLVVALAVAVGAWLGASSGAGAATRAGLARGIGAVRSGGTRAGMDTGRLGVFLHQYRVAVRTVILVVAALWYLSVDHPTGQTALGLVVGVVVALAVAEVLAAPPTVAESPAVTGREGGT